MATVNDETTSDETTMTVRPVMRYPDPALARPAEPVLVFDEALRVLVDDLRDTMQAAEGIGITAPHVGVSQRVVVLGLSPTQPVRVFVNPVLTEHSTERQRHPEGSISMPGVTESVERPARVRVRYQDLDGHWHEEQADGLLSVCLQHEIDQLDGRFWLQRLSALKRDRLIRRWRRAREPD